MPRSFYSTNTRRIVSRAVVMFLVAAVGGGHVPGQELATITGEFYAFESLAFSPNGQWLAMPGHAGDISIWNVNTADLVRRVEDRNAQVAFVEDGTTLVSASIDKPIRLWDISSGRRLDKDDLPKLNYDAIAFSPDGRTLAGVSPEGSVALWDVRQGRKRAETKVVPGAEETGMNNIGYSRDGQTLVAHVWPQHLRVLDAQTLDLRHTSDRWTWNQPSPVADGGWLVEDRAGGELGGNDSERRELLTAVNHALAPSSDAYSPDGKLLAAGMDRPEIGLWELRTGHRLATLRCPDGHINRVAFSPDGKILASSHGTHVVKLWDVGQAERQKLREDNPNQSDLQKLQGTWLLVAAERNGTRVLPPHDQYRFDGHRLTIARDRERLKGEPSLAAALALRTGSTISVECEYQLNDEADPRQMDWSGKWAGRTFSRTAIYKVEGDTLRLCTAPDRPTEFATSANDGRRSYVLERVSPERLGACEALSHFGLSYELGYERSQLDVDLSGTQISDGDLRHLRFLPNLRNLKLRHTSIAGPSLVHLNDLLGFEHLDLSDTQISDTGLAHLKGLRYLRGLKVRGTQITDAGLAAFVDLPELAALDLGGTEITDDGLAIFQSLSKIWDLDLSDTGVTDAGLKHLAETPRRLSRLVLDGTQITDDGLAQLEKQFSLDDIGLARTRVTDAGMDHLKQQFHLESVDLSGTRISDTALRKLKEHQRLTKLRLSDTRISNAGLEHLKDLENLEHLDLSRTQVTAAGLESIRELPELSCLKLAGIPLSDTDLPRLAQFRNLYELDLSHTPVTDAALDALEELPCRRLNLKETRVTAAGLRRLRKARYWEEIEY